MTTRKRKFEAACTSNHPKKKVKASSNSRDNQNHTSSQSSTFYTIRDIVDEKASKYLIDWDDDPVTGEKFERTWEPKYCANELAVTAWEQKKQEAKQRKQEARQKKPGTAKPLGSESVHLPEEATNETPAAKIRPDRRSRVVRSSPSPPPEAQLETSPEHQVEAEIADSQLPQSTPNSRPRVAVEISPHNSLLHNPDIPLISSVPLPNYQSGEEEIDSTTRGSSPIPRVSRVTERNQSLIVPDSQSNHNSSDRSLEGEQFQHDTEPEESIPESQHNTKPEESIPGSQYEDSWQSGQGIHDPVPPSSELLSRSPRSQVSSPRGDIDTGETQIEEIDPQADPTTEPAFSSQIEEHHTETSRSTDCSVLTQRNPNSQPDKSGHSTELKEDGLVASVEPSDLGPEHLSTSPSTSHHHPQPFTSSALPRIPSPKHAMSDAAYTNSSPRKPSFRPNEPSPGNPPLKDKLRNLRNPQSPPSQLSKSPSMIPQAVQSEASGDSRLRVQSVDISLSSYNQQSDLYTPSKPSKLAFHYGASQKRNVQTLKIPTLDHMEYIVSLPAPGRVKDEYVNLIKYHKQTIQDFMDEKNLDEQLMNKVDHFLEIVDSACTHIDLSNPTTISQQLVPPDQEAQYALSCSAKFEFLKELITCMHSFDIHIVLVAQSGRLLDIVEAMMKWMRVEYNRPDSQTRSDSMTRSRLRFTILPSGEQASPTVFPAANAIIAFDGSFGHGAHQLRNSRRHLTNTGQLAPVIHPMVYASSEHIALCIPDWLAGTDRKKAMVSCVTQARTLFGELSTEESTPKASAEEVAEFIKGGCVEGTWTLPSIRSISIEGVEWGESSQSSTTQLDTQATRDESDVPMIRKRSHDAMNDSSSLKRQRLTPGPETSHVSDSAAQTSQVSMSDVQKALQDANAQFVSLKISHQARESSLQDTINALQKRLQENLNDTSLLQDRYEQVTAAHNTLRHEKDELVAVAESAEKKLASRATEISDLKDERKRLKEELEEARNGLKNSTIPETAELEKAKEEARTAVRERDSLQKKIASLQRDFEFTRQHYQQASTSAAENANRNAELETENAELRKKASGEALKLKEVNLKNALTQHEKRIQQLETMVEDRDELLKKKDRGRGVQTRSGSVQPRSPRPSNSRAGSRAGSPMPPVPFGGGGGLGMKVGSALRHGYIASGTEME